MNFNESFYAELIRVLLIASLPVRYLFKNKNFQIQKKEDNSPLTTADLISNKILEIGLTNLFSHVYYLSEESPLSKTRFSSEYVWIVDPIDGTREFSNLIAEYSISVGLAFKERAICGIIVIPEENCFVFNKINEISQTYTIDYLNLDLYMEKLAELNSLFDYDLIASQALDIPIDLNKSIQLKDTPPKNICNLKTAKILVSVSEFKAGLFDKMQKDGFNIIPTGSIARKLALLASGQGDMVISLKPKNEWDICAGHALVSSNPGYKMTDIENLRAQKYNQENLITFGVVAGPKELVEKFHSYYTSCVDAT